MPFSAQHLKSARLHLMQSSAQMKRIVKNVGPFKGRMVNDPRVKDVRTLSDELAMQHLVESGVASEEAEELLFFALGRLDILPLSNEEFLQSARQLFQLPSSTAEPAWQQLIASWRPYCSVAGWYVIQAAKHDQT